jgi:hypothetical protein
VNMNDEHTPTDENVFEEHTLETPAKPIASANMLGWEIDTETATGILFTLFCGILLALLVWRRKAAEAERKAASTYEQLRAKSVARTARLELLQREQDDLAEVERHRKEEESLERQKIAQAAKLLRLEAELQGGQRSSGSHAAWPARADGGFTPTPPTQRQVEMKQIEDAFQRAMSADTEREASAAQAAAADASLLSAAVLCAEQAGIHVTVLPAKLARRTICSAGVPGSVMVMVRTSPEMTGGMRHVSLRCPAQCTLLQVMAALHASVPGGVLGRALVQAHPRTQLADGDDLPGALPTEEAAPLEAPAPAAGGGLDATLTAAGISHRAMLMLRSKQDA